MNNTPEEERKPQKSKGAANKRKGSNAERFFAQRFREIGSPPFKRCVTSRLGSRLHDNAGIDLIFLPFNPQIKAGYDRGLNPSKELKYLDDRIDEIFPEDAPERDKVNVLIHRKTVGRGVKRTKYDDIVSMTYEDFEALIKKIEKW